MSEATVCLTFDFDAVSAWLHWEGRDGPTNLSRGVFGAEVGAPRILDLLAERDLPATWFTPGHTIDSFPEVCADVWSRGHDVQHHGWSHVSPSDYDSREAEQADVERGIESIVELTGRKPTGYRSPSWDFSEHTLDILLDLGFEWDSSGMAREFRPYYQRRDWEAPRDGPYVRGTPTDLVELPVSWQRDDFPPLAFVGRGFVDEAAIFRGWRESFDWMYDTVEDGVFVLTMHPQVVGQGRRLARFEKLLAHMQDRPGVRFETMASVAEAFRD